MIHPVFIVSQRTPRARDFHYVYHPAREWRFAQYVLMLVDGVHTPRQIAARLNASIFDVLEALDYWYRVGYIRDVPPPPPPPPPTRLELKLARAHVIAEFNRQHPTVRLPWWQQLAFFIEGLLPRPKVKRGPVLRYA